MSRRLCSTASPLLQPLGATFPNSRSSPVTSSIPCPTFQPVIRLPLQHLPLQIPLSLLQDKQRDFPAGAAMPRVSPAGRAPTLTATPAW